MLRRASSIADAPYTNFMTPPFTIRPAGTSDVAELVDLVNAAYREHDGQQGWTTEAALLGGKRTDAEEILVALSSPTARILVGISETRIVASCRVEQHTRRDSEIGMFAVHPSFQGKGIGLELLEHGETLARVEFGAARILLYVIQQREELIAWYERHGYTPTGLNKPFPYGDERFGVPKRVDLMFMELAKEIV